MRRMVSNNMVSRVCGIENGLWRAKYGTSEQSVENGEES